MFKVTVIVIKHIIYLFKDIVRYVKPRHFFNLSDALFAFISITHSPSSSTFRPLANDPY